MFLEQHLLRTLKLNAASSNNCNFIEVDWLAHEHEIHYGLCKRTDVFESLISEIRHEAVAFIQMDDHPSSRGWKFPASWTVFSAGGFSASHIDIPLVTETPSLARRMLRRLQQQLHANTAPAPSRRPLNLFYMGRSTHIIRQLSSLQWSVLGPFPRSLHVNVHQPVSVDATVAHHALLQSSTYSLAPRGNGGTSFRICEAISAGSIPIYIWNNTIEEGAVLPQLSRPFSDFSLFFSSSHLPLLPSVLDCIADDHLNGLVELGREVAHDFTVPGVIRNVFTSLNRRAMPRMLLSRSDGLLDILQRALEGAAARHRRSQLCHRSDIRVCVSIAYILRIANLESVFDCRHDAASEQSCKIGQSRIQLQQLINAFQRSVHDVDYSVGKSVEFSSAQGQVNSTTSVCHALIISMQSLLQCSILSPELLFRASFVLRTCLAPLHTWAGLVKRALQLCAPESQSSELERGDPESACSASTAVRVASENLALKLELFKQQKSASKFHRKGAQRGTLAGNISNPCRSNLTHRLTVYIIGAATSAPLLQEYRDSLRTQGIEHVDPPTKGSCLVIATHVATIVYAPFIVLGKSLFTIAFYCECMCAS
jgi:hypothetical protein